MYYIHNPFITGDRVRTLNRFNRRGGLVQYIYCGLSSCLECKDRWFEKCSATEAHKEKVYASFMENGISKKYHYNYIELDYEDSDNTSIKTDQCSESGSANVIVADDIFDIVPRDYDTSSPNIRELGSLCIDIPLACEPDSSEMSDEEEGLNDSLASNTYSSDYLYMNDYS